MSKRPGPSSNIILCECGCGKSGSRFRMEEIRCEYFERSGDKMQELRQRTGRRFQVLPEHREPFQRELNGLMAMKQLTDKFAHTHWLFRLVVASGSIFRAQWFVDRRHHSWWQTFKYAARVAIVFSTPDRISEKLTKRWKRDMRAEREERKANGRASQDAPAKESPVCPSEPSRSLS